jgi:preprotein translocase subunit SecA
VFGKLLTKIFGTNNERVIKRLLPLVDQINAFEPQILPLTDEQLRGKTVEFRARIAERIERHYRRRRDPGGGERCALESCCPRPLPWFARRASAR